MTAKDWFNDTSDENIQKFMDDVHFVVKDKDIILAILQSKIKDEKKYSMLTGKWCMIHDCRMSGSSFITGCFGERRSINYESSYCMKCLNNGHNRGIISHSESDRLTGSKFSHENGKEQMSKTISENKKRILDNLRTMS